MQLDNELFIANVGNSLSFVAVYLDEKLIYMVYQSDRDKPSYPQERQRIEDEWRKGDPIRPTTTS
jgi:hypothetical protein